MTLGGPPECPTFAGCEPGLKKVYGLNFAGFKSLDEAGPLSVAALKNGEVQVVELFSSDGNVVSNNFVALTDNKHLEGADYIVPVIRKSVDTAGVASGPGRAGQAADDRRHLQAQPRRHGRQAAAGRRGQDVAAIGGPPVEAPGAPDDATRSGRRRDGSPQEPLSTETAPSRASPNIAYGGQAADDGKTIRLTTGRV